MIEGVLARGDRRLSAVIERAYQSGCMYDAWSEYFHYDIWLEALEAEGLSLEFYTAREREKDELLPWDFIDVGVRRDFLWQEYERSKEGIVTPNCREKCAGCGARVFGGGVCYEG